VAEFSRKSDLRMHFRYNCWALRLFLIDIQIRKKLVTRQRRTPCRTRVAKILSRAIT
jgi:hypothetical protein